MKIKLATILLLISGVAIACANIIPRVDVPNPINLELTDDLSESYRKIKEGTMEQLGTEFDEAQTIVRVKVTKSFFGYQRSTIIQFNKSCEETLEKALERFELEYMSYSPDGVHDPGIYDPDGVVFDDPSDPWGDCFTVQTALTPSTSTGDGPNVTQTVYVTTLSCPNFG